MILTIAACKYIFLSSSTALLVCSTSYSHTHVQLYRLSMTQYVLYGFIRAVNTLLYLWRVPLHRSCDLKLGSFTCETHI